MKSPDSIRTKNVFLGIFLLLQILLPLRSFLVSDFDSRRNFSWNMYSRRYECAFGYAWIDYGTREPSAIRTESYFQHPPTETEVYHRDAIDAWHAFLCGQLTLERGPGFLRGKVECNVDGGPAEILLRPETPLCSLDEPEVGPS